MCRRQVTVESFETMRQMYQAMRQADQEYDARSSRQVEWRAATEKNCTHTMPRSAWRRIWAVMKSGENGKSTPVQSWRLDGGRMR